MVDLSKHLARAKQSLDKRQYDYVLQQMEECLDLDPVNLDVHKMLLDAARKKAKEGAKTSIFASLTMPSMSADPHKQLVAQCKRLGKNPEPKVIADVAEAALKMSQTVKPMYAVAIFYYDEFLASGLYNGKVLWDLANVLFERYRESKDNAQLDKAIKLLRDLERANPNHPEASRTIKNWEAMRSMTQRVSPTGGDYRSQLASTSQAKKAEAMNRNLRTLDDAKEVIEYLEQDLAANPADKQLWVKKGDIHLKFNQLPEAKAAFTKAQEIDTHDFTVAMKLGDVELKGMKLAIEKQVAAGEDVTQAKADLLQAEIAEYRRRVERQPTDMTHRYNLGIRYIQCGEIDLAAAEFQKTVGDPKVRQESHRYLGFCFAKKNLLDLAVQQYTSYLSLALDDQADKSKEVRYLRARVLDDQGKRDDAIKDFERIVAIDLNYKDAAARLSKLRGM
jgi:tetratricopeptide (TPR) repeat protein